MPIRVNSWLFKPDCYIILKLLTGIKLLSRPILEFVVLAAVLALIGARESLSTIFTEMQTELGIAAADVGGS